MGISINRFHAARVKECAEMEKEQAKFALTVKQMTYVFSVFSVLASCFYFAGKSMWIFPTFVCAILVFESLSNKEESNSLLLLASLSQFF